MRYLLSIIAAATMPLAAFAQTYPDRPMRMVVPYPPGAAADMIARLVAQKLSESMGHNVIVDNRAGASGAIGSDFVAKAAPDGYTFQIGNDATHAGNFSMSKNPPYDPVRDFTPIVGAVANIIALGAHPSVPAANMTELIEYAKKNPGKLAYGSSGTASPHHLAGVLLAQRAGIDIVHVPYKGGGPAVQDTLGGQLPLVFSSLVTITPHFKSGRIRALGMAELKRHAGAPDLPAIAETLPGFVMSSWLGFFAPAKLPAPILARLNAEMTKALNAPDVRTKLESGGLIVTATSSADFAAQVKADVEERGRLLKAAGVQPE
jgi:tripartite-type tricarboxylate transporter receptor subunit TctC